MLGFADATVALGVVLRLQPGVVLLGVFESVADELDSESLEFNGLDDLLLDLELPGLREPVLRVTVLVFCGIAVDLL